MRNVLENPGWYTPYTPYQAEIAQGRLEALLTFQTMVSDLTGMEVANASLLDEATAAAEAMAMLHRVQARRIEGMSGAPQFFVADSCFPQTIDLLSTRAEPLGIELIVGDFGTAVFGERVFGALVQTPDEAGRVHDLQRFHRRGEGGWRGVAVGTDLLSLVLLTPPGEIGADVAFGNSQRFGVPLGTAARMPPSSPRGSNTSARCPAASSAFRWMPTVARHTEWRCRPASSTSAARRRHRISAPRRRCSPTSPPLYAVYHGPKG